MFTTDVGINILIFISCMVAMFFYIRKLKQSNQFGKNQPLDAATRRKNLIKLVFIFVFLLLGYLISYLPISRNHMIMLGIIWLILLKIIANKLTNDRINQMDLSPQEQKEYHAQLRLSRFYRMIGLVILLFILFIIFNPSTTILELFHR